MAAVETWKWSLAFAFLLGSAFCSGTETALTAIGDARARQLRDAGGRRARMLSLWIDHPERVLSTLLIVNTLVNVGAGALAGAIATDLVVAHPSWSAASVVAAATATTTVVVLFLGEIVPKTVGKRHPVRLAILSIPLVRALAALLWPLSTAATKLTSALVGLFGGAAARGPTVTSEEIEYLIEMGSREGVLDEVKEELLNSVLEFADRVVREIMIPRTRMAALDREASPEELLRVVKENPYSRMPVYEGSIDNVVGVLLVRDVLPSVLVGDAGKVSLQQHLKPPFFVPEQMKISRLLKEMQRRKTHIAIVVDEFGGTSGLATLEDVIEEIVGEIQDEADVESAPVKALSEGVWLAEASVPLHELEALLNEGEGPAGPGGTPPVEVRFPEDGDFETLGGFVTAHAGRVPPVGAVIAWDGLTFVVRAGDERRVTRVEIARAGRAVAAPEPAASAAGRRG
ncbi:MAG TPA: hemolysin family protein [Anaeromyxobacteraceae bacterium]|nr:hemolysin family protein [Anaeromyxobacteraceae bacterium]